MKLDPLTGLLRRPALDDILKSLADESSAAELPTSVLYVDLDRFKMFNDQHGHDAGDVLLREIGELLLATCPPPAHVCRHGGDEFAVLLDSTGFWSAKRKAEEICEAIRAHAEAREPRGVTASIGVATAPLRTAWSSRAHLEMADHRAGVAKACFGRQGRAWAGDLPKAWGKFDQSSTGGRRQERCLSSSRVEAFQASKGTKWTCSPPSRSKVAPYCAPPRL